MNIELIKKYKVEFDHWLNGGKLLAYYKTDEEPKWWSDEESMNYDGVDNFSSILQNSLKLEDVLIVIDDEYVEFRKALAEGKIVQYYECVHQNELCSNLDKYDWLDWKAATPSSSFTKSLNYRIKPQEPKFKVGDWVMEYNITTETPIGKGFVGNIQVTAENLNSINNNGFNKLWQPKEGEWCWVGYKLMKFSKLIKEDYSTTFEFISPDKDAGGCKIKEYILERHLQVVEPFIGQLPTKFKGL